MSYCRFSDSDVYAYASMDGQWTVHVSHAGMAHAGETHDFETLGDFYDFMQHLIEVGYKVPACAIERIEEELATCPEGRLTTVEGLR